MVVVILHHKTSNWDAEQPGNHWADPRLASRYHDRVPFINNRRCVAGARWTRNVRIFASVLGYLFLIATAYVDTYYHPAASTRL